MSALRRPAAPRRPRTRRLTPALSPLATAVLVGLGASCGGAGADRTGVVAPPPPVAAVARVAFAQSADTATQGDTTRALAVTAYDATGHVLTGRAVAYASSDPSVATVDAQGRAAALAGGTATITATVEGQSATAALAVRALGSAALYPTTLAMQPGAKGALWAVARDATGLRVPVTHAGFASADPAVAVVDPGTGAVTAVGPGSTTITATLNGRAATSAVTVRAASAAVPYPITLRFVGPVDPALQAAARRAANRWQRAIRSAGATVHVALGPDACAKGLPADTEDVAGLTVVLRADSLAGAVVGLSTGCVARDGADGQPYGTTAYGVVLIDSTRTRGLVASAGTAGSAAEALFAHEIAHVLGIGTRWLPGSVARVLVTSSATDPRYVGTAGDSGAASLGLGGSGGVPVQASGGYGTAGSHWRSGALGDELMTPYVGSGMSLSALTLGAVADLGYAVDPSAADVTTAAALDAATYGPLDPRAPTTGASGVSADRIAGAVARMPLREIVEGPRFAVGRDGRVRRLPTR